MAFLDADDEWLPEFLETILRLREKWPEAGMYSTAWINDYPDGRRYPSKCYGIGAGFEGVVPSVFRCAAMDGVFPGYTSSIVVPKDVFLRVGGFREDSYMGEDLDLWGRIGLNYPNVHCSDPHVCYHHDDEMAATKNPSLRIQYEFPFQKSIREMEAKSMLNDANLCYDVQLYLYSLDIRIAWSRIACGDLVGARTFLKKCKYDELQVRWFTCVVRTYIPASILPILRVFVNLLNKFR